MNPADYAMVTVKLGHAQVERGAAFQEIKQALALKSPAIDENFGAIPMGPNDQYVVLVDTGIAQKMKDENHPNILGVFSNPKMEAANSKKPLSKAQGM